MRNFHIEFGAEKTQIRMLKKVRATTFVYPPVISSSVKKYFLFKNIAYLNARKGDYNNSVYS